MPEARASIGKYLDFYNGWGPHQSLGRQTPDQAYFNAPQPIPVAALSKAESTYKTAPDCSNKPSHFCLKTISHYLRRKRAAFSRMRTFEKMQLRNGMMSHVTFSTAPLNIVFSRKVIDPSILDECQKPLLKSWKALSVQEVAHRLRIRTWKSLHVRAVRS